MTKSYYEFLSKMPMELLLSPCVSGEDFDFMLENINNDINDIEFEPEYDTK